MEFPSSDWSSGWDFRFGSESMKQGQPATPFVGQRKAGRGVGEGRRVLAERATALLLGLLTACSADEGTDTPPALRVFEVVVPELSPAQLRLGATRATRIALFYDAGGGERALGRLAGPGVSSNAVNLTAGETLLDWDFAAELGSGSLRTGVRLIARSLAGAPVPGGELTLDLGNDAPVVALEPLDPEVDG